MSETLNKIFNGTHSAVNDVLNVMFKAIAEKYNLEAEDVQQTALEAADELKNKDVKLKLMPKAPKKGGFKPPKKKTGYQLYCKDVRPKAKELLINNVDERKWTTKDNVEIEVVLNSKSGDPDFKHINQKCADMWWKLSNAEQQEWRDKAAADVVDDGEKEQPKKVEKPATKAKPVSKAQEKAVGEKKPAAKTSAKAKAGSKPKAPKSADKSTTEKSIVENESVKEENDDETQADEAVSEAVAEESNEPPPRKNGAGRKPKSPETPQQQKKAGRPKGTVGKVAAK